MIKKLLIAYYGLTRKIINDNKLKSVFSVDKFINIPKKELNVVKENKIKIRFLCGYGAWTYIDALIKQYSKDDKYDVRAIIGQTGKLCNVIEHLNGLGVEYFFDDEYNVENDKPDIAIFYFPLDDIKIDKLRGNCKLIVSVESSLCFDSSASDFWKWARCYKIYKPDYILVDKLLYNDLLKQTQTTSNLILMGNPVYDDIYNSLNEKNKAACLFDKLKNKRTLLWATDHGIFDGKIANDVTFDIYAKLIFDYFDKHKDIGLIFRPHPTFIREMIKNDFWTQDDFEKLKLFINKSENIVFDDSELLNNSMLYCDAIIVDAFCSVACCAYPLHKPIGLLYRNEKINAYHKELGNSLISIKNITNLLDFLHSFSNDFSNLCNVNYNDSNILCNFDGNNSIRIKRFIEDKYTFLSNNH